MSYYPTRRRTYARRPYTPRRRNYSRARYTRSAPRVTVGRGFKGVYNRSPAEKKFVDTGSSGNFDDAAAVILPINVIDEGTSVSQRVGRKVCIKSVQIRGRIGINKSSTVVNPIGVRCMLVWDKQTNGAVPTISDILDASDEPYAFMNLDNRERFVVLMDKQYSFAGNQSSTLGQDSSTPVVANIKKYKALPPNQYTIFDGTGAGIADISTGAIFLVLVSDYGSAGAGACNRELRMRIRYTDA